MKTLDPSTPWLVEVIQEHRQAILVAWKNDLLATVTKNSLNLQAGEVETIATACLDAFVEGVRNGVSDAATTPFSEFTQRLDSRILISLETLYQLRTIILEVIKTEKTDPGNRLEAPLEATVQRLAARLIDQNAAGLQKKIDEANARVTQVNYIVNMVASGLDLTEVLTQAGKIIATAAGASHSFFYMISEEGDLMIFMPASDPSFVIFNIPGPNLNRFSRELLDPNDALWLVLDNKKPIAIFDALQSPHTSQKEDIKRAGMKSFLLVPCLSKGQVVAVAVVQTFDKQKEFTPEEIEAAQAIASVVAPAIENARLHQKVEQLAALEERARMARAMHDSLAQTLGAMQLKASQAGDMLDRDKLEAARMNVTELNEIARQAYTDVREAIFNLRARAPGGADFVPYLRNYLSMYQTCFGITTSLEAEAGTTSGVSDECTDQIMYIIQESLTNTRKHAEASSIQVQMERSPAILQVDLLDNGAGFDPSSVKTENAWEHFGLEIMKERAAAIGGMLNIDSLPGMGTRVRLTVPVQVPPNLIIESRQA
jgi:signal transduction histidine kinase